MTQPDPQKKPSPNSNDEQVLGSATWAAIFLALAALALFIYAFNAVNFQDPQDYVLVGFPIFLAGTSLASIFIMRRGRLGLGSGIIFSLNLLVPLLLTIILSSSMWPALAYGAVSSALLIWRSLPRRSWLWSIIATAIVLIAVVIINLINSPDRLAPPPEFDLVFSIVIAAVIVAFLIQAVRQAWGRSLRNNLLVAFIGITLIAAGAMTVYVFISTNNILQQSLERDLTARTDEVAVRIGALISEQIDTLTTLSGNGLLQSAMEEANNTYVGDSATIQSVLDAKDTQWRAADATNDNTDPLVQEALTNLTSLELLKFKNAFANHAEVFTTDVYGGLIGTTNRTSDFYQADEDWWQAAYNDGQGAIYLSEPVYDPSAGALSIQISLPVRNSDSGEIIGILRSTYLASSLSPILSPFVGQTGATDLYIPGDVSYRYYYGQISEITPEQFAEVQAIADRGIVEMEYDGNPSVVLQTKVNTLEGNRVIENLGWIVVFHQSQDEAYAPLSTQIRGIVFVLVIVVVFAVVGAIILAVFLVRPIVQLTQTAQEIAAGNLTSRASVTSGDEIGTLASTFNSMTARLQETLQGLEQRVAARTRNLELAADVGRSVSQLQALDIMLKDACDLILKEFNLYYVQVYLVDPSQTTLKLEAGTGEVGAQLIGRGHSLPLNTGSLNGRAAIEQHSVVIPDTALSVTFRPNDLLPETRGEMAVPLMVAGKVVGVLDMQSREPGALNDEVLPAFEALAGQLAVAVQNANLLAEAEQARSQVEAQSRRLVREAWTEYMDAIHKPERMGFVFDQKTISPMDTIEEIETSENEHVVSAPIVVTGEPLGSLEVEIEDETRRVQFGELINVVARQVAQQIENLRLLESAERYRYEAEQAIRLQTIEGWQAYIQSRPVGGLGYLYDQREVRPGDEDQFDSHEAFSLPVKAREQVVGRLAVQGLSADDTDAVELASVVAERLGAHIENLRLFEETRRGQLELDKRARQLAAVAQVSTASSQELDVQRILETVVHQTQRQFGLYHAHVFILDERTQELRIAACGWKEGDEHEGTHETGLIPVSREQSLVARAAQTRRPVLVNDVRSDPNWLPNPQLPATRSELAVPLLIGDRVLGVMDVQSDQLNAFTEEDANIQLTLASQVAVSLQNAFSFAQAQRQAEREALLNTINQKIQSATSVEAVLQIAARELGHALKVPRTIAQISIKDQK